MKQCILLAFIALGLEFACQQAISDPVPGSETSAVLLVVSPDVIAGPHGPTGPFPPAPVQVPITGEVVYLGDGCPGQDYTPFGDPYPTNMTGKIAIIDANQNCNIGRPIARASAAGAIGVILVMDDGFPAELLSSAFDSFPEPCCDTALFAPTLFLDGTTANLLKYQEQKVQLTMVPQFGKPGAIVTGSRDVSLTSSSLQAIIYPNGQPTTAFLRYGKDANYGAATPELPYGSALEISNANIVLDNLEENTVYHYSLVTVANGETVVGPDQVFRTASRPVILSGIVNTTAMAGEPVVVTLAVEGTGPFSFEWSKEGEIIRPFGIGSSSLSLPPVQLNTAGTYSVAVSNIYSASVGLTTARFALSILPQQVPTVTTQPAQDVKKIEATLVGSVNPNGGKTSVHFQYGTTTSYGESTAPVAIGNGVSPASIIELLPLLAVEPNTTYHYRLVASSVAGTSHGEDVTFITQAAATFVVQNTENTGAGSLRAAIGAAELADRIEFDPGLLGKTIALTTALSIDHGVRIFGPGASQLKISGKNATTIFFVSKTGRAVISGISIIAGKSPRLAAAGGVWNEGDLTLEDCRVTENSAIYFGGGGILNRAGLTIRRCFFGSNTTVGMGGAIYNERFNTNSVRIYDSTFLSNSNNANGNFNVGGGAIYTESSIVISNCVFENNLHSNKSSQHPAFPGGGAIVQSSYNGTPTELTIINSTFKGNTTTVTGGAIANTGGGTLTVRGSAFIANIAGNGGGGIYTEGKGTATIENSAFTENRGSVGGAVDAWADSTVSIRSSTLVGNIAKATGYGGGLYAYAAVKVSIASSIIAASGLSNPDVTASDINGDSVAINSLGYNLIGAADGLKGLVASDLRGTLASRLDPMVAAIADNGGLTWSIALQPGSPAIDAGGLTSAEGATSLDQRGVIRPQGASADIGAYEVVVISRPMILSQVYSGPGSVFTLTFEGVRSKTYFLEFASSLSQPQWKIVANTTGSGGPQALAHNGVTTAIGFYRLRVE